MQGADLTQVRLQRAYLTRANLAGATLERADLSHARASQVNMQRSRLVRANLQHASLQNAHLNRADLTEADLTHADLAGADFRGADLTQARLSNALLGSGQWNDANLSGADLHGAEFYLPAMDLPVSALQDLRADQRVVDNIESGAPPLQGLTLLKFGSSHTGELVSPSAPALPALEQGGYLVVAALPNGHTLHEATLMLSPTSNALWNGGSRPPGAELKPQRSHRVLAQSEVFAGLAKDAIMLGATLVPEATPQGGTGSAARYRLSTQSWSVNRLIDGFLGTQRVMPVLGDSTRPDDRPNNAWLPPDLAQALAERLSRDLGIVITTVDGRRQAR
jgi:hypothetical protein